MRRGDVDDASELARLHLRHHRFDQVECGEQVDREDCVPFVVGKLLDRRDVLDAGVVDDDVDLAELGACQLGHRTNLVRTAHVGARVAHLHAVLALHFGTRELDLVGIAEAVQQDVGALFGQAAGDAQADPAGRPGNDG